MPNAADTHTPYVAPIPAPAAEGPSLTPAQRRVAAALAEVQYATAAELTAHVGVSKSSVAKTLTLLESTGAAIRTIREQHGFREADQWSPGPALSSLLFGADGPVAGPESGAAPEEPGGATGVASAQVRAETATEGPALPVSLAAETETTSEGEPECEIAVVRPTDSAAAPEEAATVPPSPGESPSDGRLRRLASGELAAMVTAVLEAHPDIEYTPTMLSHMLKGRSAGAIHNVLEKLVATGAVARTRDKPKSYRLVATEVPNPA
ncbi:hypothetical protein ABH935_005398 [Catenulispora sp. GAS73]|uniref:MarR family transcriptional regulator n=1 Tax=Catenulispora sp. GAS73 TaxID=3156269 RepID=UPI003512D4C9